MADDVVKTPEFKVGDLVFLHEAAGDPTCYRIRYLTSNEPGSPVLLDVTELRSTHKLPPEKYVTQVEALFPAYLVRAYTPGKYCEGIPHVYGDIYTWEGEPIEHLMGELLASHIHWYAAVRHHLFTGVEVHLWRVHPVTGVALDDVKDSARTVFARMTWDVLPAEEEEPGPDEEGDDE